MKRVIKKVIKRLLLMLIISEPLYGVTSIESSGEFYYKIESDLVIAHFYYKEDKIDKKSEEYENYQYISALFENADSRESEIHFIKINIERDFLSQLGKKYGITKDQTSAFVLFKYGKKVAAMTKINADTLTTDQIQDFIDKYFSKEIQEKLKRKAEIRQQIEEENRYLNRYWWYDGYPYGYGYYGYPYYYPGYWGPGYWRSGYYGYPYGGVGFGVVIH